MEENFAGRLAVGRGMPSGKFLSLYRQRQGTKKWRPDILARVPPKGSDAFFYWADEIQ
jgi:hypothetical protein